MKNRILILSAGRRVELVQCFQQAIRELNLQDELEVITADAKPELSAACQVGSSSFKLPKVTESQWGNCLKELCLNEAVKIVIPTIDTELGNLAELEHRFRELGVNLVISSRDLIALSRDKRLTGALFERAGIRYPNIYDPKNLEFPCFCKPYDGSSSIGAHALNEQSDLTDELLSNSRNMFMELIPKTYVEVTVDTYFDRNGNLRSLVPRERIEIRGGEVSKGITRKGELYKRLFEGFKNLVGGRGCLTLQVFWDKTTDDVIGLEVNPRFGGGYPLTDSSGAKFARWLLEEYILNESIPLFEEWKENLLMLRYDTKVLVET